MGDKREQQLARDTSQESILSGLNSHSTSDFDGMGSKKRRPASPEVVVHARPRTPSSHNGNASFEQSQSPTKKQRTSNNGQGIEERLIDANIFATSWQAEASTSSKTPGSIAGLSIDIGVASTTETFAHLSTLTPGSSSQQETKQLSRGTASRPPSKPSSPTARSRTTPVVEIYQSRPPTADAKKISPPKSDENSGRRRSATEDNGINADKSVEKQDQSDEVNGSQAFHHQPSPELEDVSLSQSKSRRSSLKDSAITLPSSSNGATQHSDSAMLSQDIPPSSQTLMAASGTSEDFIPKEASQPSSSALPPSAMFKNAWGIVPPRRAATAKKKYADVSSDEEDSDEVYVSTSAARSQGKKTPVSKGKGKQKGKARATEDIVDLSSPELGSDASLSESSAQRKKTSKPESATKSRAAPSASKQKRPLPKSKSENNVSTKTKGKSKQGRQTSDSSDYEQLFGAPLPSPSKRVRSTSKAKSPTKPVTAASKARPSLLTARPISGNSSDDDLPTLPFSSQPPPNSQSRKPFDLLEIDDDAFVAIPARRKTVSNGILASPSSLLRFWWPAKITNRNRRNFTVSPVLDEPNQEILQFSEKSFIIPEAELDYDRLQKLSYHSNTFPTAQEAFDAVTNHTEADLYELPSSKAYSSAIELALKKEKADRTDSDTKVQAEDEVSMSSASDFDIDLNLSKEAKMQFGGSDSDDSQSDIEVDAVGLGRNKNVWWPCRVIKVADRSNTGNSASSMKARRKPYQVEFFPYQKAQLSRKELVLKQDEEFFTVPLGEIATKQAEPVAESDLREVLEDLAQTSIGQYAADSNRHALFMSGNPAERAHLKKMALYGQYDEVQIKQISDYLLDWAFGRKREAVALPVEAAFHTLKTDVEKTDYVAMVLLPVALEILTLNDDDTTAERALERLKEAGNNRPSDIEVRIEAHKVAGEDLSSTTEWWEDILNLRHAHSAGQYVRQAMNTEFKDEHLEAMGFVTRRRTNKVSYKE